MKNRLVALLLALAMAPPASAASSGSGSYCAGQAAAPGHLALQLGKSKLLSLSDGVANRRIGGRSIGDPSIVQAMLIGPDTLYVLGLDVGSTNMIIKDTDGQCSVLDVVVGIDPDGLRSTLAALMPEETDIRVSAAADSLVLSGTVADASVAARVVELASAYVRRPARALAAAPKGEAGDGANAAMGGPAGGNVNAGAGGAVARLVNLLNVSAPQQVMLEVKIAEVSKSLIDKLEAGVALNLAGGGWSARLASNFLTGTLGGLLDLGKGRNGRLSFDAERLEGLVRILAEPNLTAISGQEGSFLAGGKIFIPVAQDNNKVTLEEKEFGVGLRFTPTVLAGGRINLRVAPEVSELSRDGIGIRAVGVSGTAVLPLITTRRAATTVQLLDGQSFAIGGLIKNNQSGNIKGLPILGELPVLGALFRSTDFQQDRTELLFVVTAHLAKPLPPEHALPTDRVGPPSRAGLFLGGRMEGVAAPALPAAPRTPAPPPPQGAAGFQLK